MSSLYTNLVCNRHVCYMCICVWQQCVYFVVGVHAYSLRPPTLRENSYPWPRPQVWAALPSIFQSSVSFHPMSWKFSTTSQEGKKEKHRDSVLGTGCPADSWGCGWPGTNEHPGPSTLSWSPTPHPRQPWVLTSQQQGQGWSYHWAAWPPQFTVWRIQATMSKKGPVWWGKSIPLPIHSRPACSLPSGYAVLICSLPVLGPDDSSALLWFFHKSSSAASLMQNPAT